MIKEITISAIIMSVLEFVFYVYLYRIKNLDITLVRSYLLTFMVFFWKIFKFLIVEVKEYQCLRYLEIIIDF